MSLECPKCHNKELHPDGDKLLIRGYKVHHGGKWHSQCLVCAGYYNKRLEITKESFNDKKGWFAS